MRTKWWRFVGGLFVLSVGVALFAWRDVSAPPGSSDRATSEVDREHRPRFPGAPSFRAEPPGPRPAALDETDASEDRERWKTAPIEAFKEALYQLDIDSIDQLHLLDDFVQVGDADTRDFWNTDWSGVDDWKRHSEGFSLERLEDGTLVFVPGQETRKAYSFFESMNVYEYDEATGEFVYEVDYYGKPLTNIVKFLRDDVMVMLVVTGQKVDMNLYELNRGRADP